MQIYCELPFLSDQVWVRMMTVVKIVLLMDRSLVKGTPFDQMFFNNPCYTSQLKYVSWLEENMSRAIGQNSMTPLGEQISMTP